MKKTLISLLLLIAISSRAQLVISGINPIVNGGTNSTFANGALNNLLPSQAGNNGKFLQTDGSNSSWQSPSGGSSQWTTTGSDIYYNTGNIGMGTSTPGQKLEVAGTVYSTSGGFKFPDGSTQTTAVTGGGSSQWTNSGSNIYFSSGNVGVGASSPTAKLHVVGTGSTSSTYALKIQNSALTDLFNVYNNGLIEAGFANGSITMGKYTPTSSTMQRQVIIGFHAGEAMSTAEFNTVIGSYAMQYATTANGNVAIGDQALRHCTTCYNNIGIGSGALSSNTGLTSYGNIAIGESALASEDGGDAGNIAVGGTAGYQNRGSWNIFLGENSFYLNTSGSRNVSLGMNAGYRCITGSGNLFLGYSAGSYGRWTDKGIIDNQARADSATILTSAPILIDFNSTASSQKITLNAVLKLGVANGTGSQSVSLGSNSNAGSSYTSAPYTWIDVRAADGTLCTMPVWRK